MAIESVKLRSGDTQGTVIGEALVAIGLATVVFGLVGVTLQIVARHTERAVAASELSAPFVVAARIAPLYQRIDSPWWAAQPEDCTIAYLDGLIDSTISVGVEDSAVALTVVDDSQNGWRAMFAAPGEVSCGLDGAFPTLQLSGASGGLGATVRAAAGSVPVQIDDSQSR